MLKSSLNNDSYYIVIGAIFFMFLLFNFLESFTSSAQVEENTRLATQQCGEGNIKSVSTESFTCKN
ncbi:hypothetical protein [Thalassotalea marina]|uniref:Uncharacterized protein n=1 Tax=Thalassotalea marina TaxID=1673741 RepID=A0A919BNM7_9GAMM|nr:hypothetical protein [Thalassotalea marina]GHG01483.1 hypothetical protein GCM10017161_32750 [Thalassotalea marina]